MCIVLPSGLPRGPVVLEGFVGKLLRSEPGSAHEVEVRDTNQHKEIHEEWNRVCTEPHFFNIKPILKTTKYMNFLVYCMNG
jgi:hypothetical protein